MPKYGELSFYKLIMTEDSRYLREKNSQKRGPSFGHVCALPYIRSTFDLDKYTLMRQITHENAILVYDLYYYGKV